MNPTITRENCGTPKGYRRHLTVKEPTCKPCREAQRIKFREQHGLPLEPPMNANELIQEIERLLRYGEGEYGILGAIGYLRNPTSLKDRLRRHGRSDLNERIFYMAEVAA